MSGGFEPPLSRDPPCHSCPHPHHILPCEWCLCASDFAPGIDTALII